MAITNYYTVDGEIVGERTGSSTINYATDALGSVTGTLVGGQLQNTYAYKPYGALLAKTGTGTDPKQQWVGSRGYRPTGRTQSDYYVSARHYGATTGRWTTSDPLWPAEPAFQYAGESPCVVVDASGATVEVAQSFAGRGAAGVQATIHLPEKCAVWPNQYVDFYVSLGTYIDFGFSFSLAHKGWHFLYKLGAEHDLTIPPDILPLHGQSVELAMYVAVGKKKQRSLRLLLNGTEVKRVAAPGANQIPHLTVGAEWYTCPPGHSAATWSDAIVWDKPNMEGERAWPSPTPNITGDYKKSTSPANGTVPYEASLRDAGTDCEYWSQPCVMLPMLCRCCVIGR